MSQREVSWAYRFAVGLLRPVFTVVTKRDWRGAEHLPSSGGFVACSNHMSYVDPITFAHFLYDNGCPPFFLGKEEVFRVPFVGWILRKADQSPCTARAVTRRPPSPPPWWPSSRAGAWPSSRRRR